MAVNLSSSGIASQNTQVTPPQAPATNGGEASPAGTGSRTAGPSDSARPYGRPDEKRDTQGAGAGVSNNPAQQRSAQAFQERIDQLKADGGSPDEGGTAEASSPSAARSPSPGIAANTSASLNGQPAERNAAAAAGTPTADGAAAEEAAFQEQMFSSFAGDVDQARQQRLSSWLPDLLSGDAAALREAAKGLTQEQASDLNSLAKTKDIPATASGTSSDQTDGKRAAINGTVTSTAGSVKALQQVQQRFGEHTLTEATPGLAPTASYDVDASLEATKNKIYEDFVSGVDEATRKQLDTWLPEALADRSKLPNKPTSAQGASLHKLAAVHGFADADAIQKGVVAAYDRAVAIETAGELPTVVDMMLVQHNSRPSGHAAADIKAPNDNIAKLVKDYDAAGFNELDSWLPDALAGRNSMPTGDPEAMALLGRFAENMGMEGGAAATPDAVIDFIKQSGAFDRALHPGQTGDDAYLLFSDNFLDNTIDYGARHGAVNDAIEADAAKVAEMLLGPDDGSGATRPLDSQALTAAVLHRTDTPLSRPQELQAATGYINKAETLTQQKERLADTLVAFHVREKVGTGPMSAREWAESFTEVSPDIVGKLNERAFNAPTSEKMQIITQHFGVPGDHEFMIDKKRKIQISNDELGNVESFDQDKKKTKWYKSVIDIAVPVIATALTFTGWGTAAGIAMNTAYSAYKGAEAIKNGDLLGGALAIAGAVTGGAASYANVAGSALSGAAGAISTASKAVNIANSSLNAHRSIESGDYLGALTSGLGGAAVGGAGQGFQTAATGINAGRALEDGDYLAAGAGLASIGGDVAGSTDSASLLAFEGIEHGLDLANAIDDKNYAGIGGAASGLMRTGNGYMAYRDEQARIEEELARLQEQQTPGQDGQGLGPVVLGPDGEPVILRAGYSDPQNGTAPQSIEIAEGDTLSQIAERHGVSVDELLAANPDITDPNRIQAGKELTLPEGVQSAQDRLNHFANINGGPSHLPSPERPDGGDPTLRPDATHPNAGDPTAMEDAQRDVGQAIDAELSSIDRRIAEIDRQLAEGINHAPVEHLRRDERLKLMAYRRDLQTLADDPDAALNALKTESSDTPFASQVGEFLENTYNFNKIYENVFDALMASGRGQAYDAVGQALAEAMKEGTTTHLDAGTQAQRALSDHHRIVVPLHELMQTALEARQLLNENQHPSLVEWMTNYTVAVHTGQLNGTPSQKDLIDIKSGNQIFPFRPGGALENGPLPGFDNLFDFDSTRSGANLDAVFGAGSSTDPDANLMDDTPVPPESGSQTTSKT